MDCHSCGLGEMNDWPFDTRLNLAVLLDLYTKARCHVMIRVRVRVIIHEAVHVTAHVTAHVTDHMTGCTTRCAFITTTTTIVVIAIALIHLILPSDQLRMSPKMPANVLRRFCMVSGSPLGSPPPPPPPPSPRFCPPPPPPPIPLLLLPAPTDRGASVGKKWKICRCKLLI